MKVKNTPHGRQNWATPWWLYRRLENLFGMFTLDVCAEEWSAKCPDYFTEKQNGLRRSWAGHKFFCNPPYANPLPWLEKGYRHTRYDGSSGIFILPATTDTTWFHDYAALGEIVLLRGRVQFDPPSDYEAPIDIRTGRRKKTGNSGGTMIVRFHPDTLQEPNGEIQAPLNVSAVRWAPRGPPQSRTQGLRVIR